MNAIFRLALLLIIILIAFGWLLSQHSRAQIDLVQAQRRIVNLETTLADSVNELRETESKLVETQARLVWLEQEIEEANNRRSQEVDALLLVIAELETAVQQRDQRIQAYEQTLTLNDNRLAALRANCVENAASADGEEPRLPWGIAGGLGLFALLGLGFAKRVAYSRPSPTSIATNPKRLQPLILRPKQGNGRPF